MMMAVARFKMFDVFDESHTHSYRDFVLLILLHPRHVGNYSRSYSMVI